MNQSLNTAREDLAFMRALAEDREPLPRPFGAHLLAAGLIWAPSPLIVWAALSGSDLVPASWANWAWIPCGVVQGIAFMLLNRFVRITEPMGPSQLVFAFAWGATALTTLALVLVLVAASIQLDKRIMFLWPALLFALYGGAWAVVAMVRRHAWYWLVVAGCFVTSILCAWLSATPEQWLVTGAGLLAWIAVPGALIALGTRDGG